MKGRINVAVANDGGGIVQQNMILPPGQEMLVDSCSFKTKEELLAAVGRVYDSVITTTSDLNPMGGCR